jgi:hypothetical protein
MTRKGGMPSKPKVFGNHGINGYYFRIANLQRIDVSSDISPMQLLCDIDSQIKPRNLMIVV